MMPTMKQLVDIQKLKYKMDKKVVRKKKVESVENECKSEVNECSWELKRETKKQKHSEQEEEKGAISRNTCY